MWQTIGGGEAHAISDEQLEHAKARIDASQSSDVMVLLGPSDITVIGYLTS